MLVLSDRNLGNFEQRQGGDIAASAFIGVECCIVASVFVGFLGPRFEDVDISVPRFLHINGS